jgi:hypothetical protein
MKSLKCFSAILVVMLGVAAVGVTAQGQASDAKDFANISSGGSSVRFDVKSPHSSAILTIAAPDGRVFSKQFKGGASPEFSITDQQGERLPDGTYTYELRLAPVLTKAARESLAANRGKDDDPEAVRAARKRTDVSLVQSGAFSIVNGAVLTPGQEERGSGATNKAPERPNSSGAPGAALFKIRQHHLAAMPKPDFVIADDLVVQGSACVGLDCVNNEAFSFDTIRLKENNTRILFLDTSTSAGFPNNDWMIRANSSASGGASFLAFVDQGASSTGGDVGTIIFEVDAGAPANSLKVSSTGDVGLRTATPVLDLHINTSDTPAHRLEQNNSGGFTAQTWDIAGNEANFFVRDVTGGSLLPFRIRPGAPTSSIDISSSGNVGIGIASPGRLLHVNATAAPVIQMTDATSGTANTDGFQIVQAGANTTIENQEAGTMKFRTSAIDRMTITAAGSVGIATTAPTDTLSVNGTASKPGGGSWAVFSDERLKNIKGVFNRGLNTVMQLQPVRYEYKPDNALGLKRLGENIGFGAQALQKVIPEAVTTSENGYMMVNNDPIIWAMLNAIKEQQNEISALKKEVRQLKAASRRQR